MMNNSPRDFLEVAVVVGTHGLRGDLKIRLLPSGEFVLRHTSEVVIMRGDQPPGQYQITRFTPHKKNFLLTLSAIKTFDRAQEMVGSSIFVRVDSLPDLPEKKFYWSELEGLSVVDQRMGALGQVVGMFTTAAHDILEVQGLFGEILIPAICPFLVRLDTEEKRLYVDLPEGLVNQASDSKDKN
jgi:16S rRNA processing protein RimM